MIPIRLYLKNFMNHSETELFLKGLDDVLIVGKNLVNEKISNGVGKTTLFSAIEYVLFNKMNSGTLDQVIKDGQKKAVVEFDFQLGADVYRVYRHRTSSGSSDLRLYQQISDDFKSISKRTPTETEEELKKIIKISHKAFTYSVLFRQADLAGISDEGDAKARIKVLKEPLNLTKYTKLEKIGQEEIKPLKKKIDNVEGSILQIGNPDDDIQKTKEEIKECNKQIEENKDLIDNYFILLSSMKKDLSDLKASLIGEDSEIHIKIENIEKELAKLKTSINKCEKDINKDDLLEVETQNEINEVIEEYKSLKDKIENLETQVVPTDDIDKNLNKVKQDETKGIELIASVKAELKHIDSTVPDDSVCPVCKQDITDDYRNHIQTETENKKKQLNKDLKFYEEAMNKCRLRKKKLENDLLKINKIKFDIKSFKQNLNYCKEKEQKNKNYLIKIQKDKQDKKTFLENLNNLLLSNSNQLQALREVASNSNVAELNSKIFILSDRIKKQEQEIENKRIFGAKLSSKLGGLEERINNKNKDKQELLNLKEKLSELNFKLKAYSKSIAAFNYKGIPTYKIRNILSELQLETNTALRILRPELEIQLDSELNIEFRRNGLVREYSQLSHGQKVYVALAFKRGLSRVIQKRLGVQLSLLEFDEVDAHLDDAGLEAFNTAISKWKEENTVFVITHNKDLKDQFSSAILVQESTDGAKASLVNSW